ncbi:MAG: histidinol-phosphatase [Gemmatimonadetes bacterium]|jgi:histidinol-phosphatase (PHP family)|nr:histidinol-phosphatase [Gemmatimonadota bacterium]MBT5060633.1 histidinol-phosphatase [Gemmatimonadota bacterium]MBT5141607.1 histidinol-phosphatase [Gemmatimonadota bacterium]MBT5590910.1 histidinol-phosphatase [Gemmatimonadota bacterium]MBT5965026.1 histidinol-phosphatase [Gemmatimonadota bacterium]
MSDPRTDIAHVSVHGGHTRFGDGEDSLAEVVHEYARQGFAWVGLTEHIPPVSDDFLFHGELEAGETAASRRAKFDEYVSVARALQKEYRDKLKIFVGFETECCTGYIEHVEELSKQHEPDYIVGSVHHVNDVVIDWTTELYAEAAAKVGGIVELYCAYFDQQFELMGALKPAVIGHFDLIRMHDKDYVERLQMPVIKDRIRRNLNRAKEIGAILDLNVRALEKGASEPYVTGSILEVALELGVPCVPGDDSHGVATVGRHLEVGISLLQGAGFDTDWPMPRGCS